MIRHALSIGVLALASFGAVGCTKANPFENGAPEPAQPDPGAAAPAQDPAAQNDPQQQQQQGARAHRRHGPRGRNGRRGGHWQQGPQGPQGPQQGPGGPPPAGEE